MKKIFILITIFLLIGAYLIKTNYNLNLEEKQGQKTFINKFALWLFELGKNIKDITASAIKMDWLPENSSAKDK